jgi:stage IV sporulation protein FB
VAGIPVRVDYTFLIFLAWIGFASYRSGGGDAAIFSVVFMLALFACVFLHELGHVFAARRYGIATRSITLLPFGGLAQLTHIPEKPAQEIAIALAGPAVNVAIAGILVAVLGQSPEGNTLEVFEGRGGDLLSRLVSVNISLAIFNLIPAFPLDGGRVLRALLAIRLGYPGATRVAARIGQIIAILLGIYGFVNGDLILLLIAGFILLSASVSVAAPPRRPRRGVVPSVAQREEPAGPNTGPRSEPPAEAEPGEPPPSPDKS